MSEILDKLLGKTTMVEATTDPKILKLRSEKVKKIDCANTTLNMMEPGVKAVRLNIFIFVVAMITFVLYGAIALFVCLMGAAVNLYYSKTQTDKILAIQEKYKLK